MLSKVTGVYRLTRDVEIRYLQNSTMVATLGLANSEKFKTNGEQRENSCFIDASIFGRLAEVANNYLRKGSKVYIVADLTLEQWVDNNGQKRSKHKLKVDSFEMLDSKGDNQNSAPSDGYAPQQQSYQQPEVVHENISQQNQAVAQSREMPSANTVPTIDIDEDELPF